MRVVYGRSLKGLSSLGYKGRLATEVVALICFTVVCIEHFWETVFQPWIPPRKLKHPHTQNKQPTPTHSYSLPEKVWSSVVVYRGTTLDHKTSWLKNSSCSESLGFIQKKCGRVWLVSIPHSTTKRAGSKTRPGVTRPHRCDLNTSQHVVECEPSAGSTT